MIAWKKLALVAASSITAAGLFMTPITCARGSQKASSKPPGSWDSHAVQVTFDGALVDENKHVLFYYVLNNTTDTDYRITDGSKVVVMGKLRDQKSPLVELSAKQVKVFYPIILPAKQRHILVIRDLRRTYNSFHEQLKENPTPKEEQAYYRNLEGLIDKFFPGFNGFILLDKASSREIDLPKGW